ncbi:MAG: GHKL domain-containing protein, partial [Lachnospiraceae bacterium]|nr:GHKL domain-containing protein [Lachnospiraceae bacterium]
VISEVLLEYIDNSSKIGIILFVTVAVLLGTTFVGIFYFAFSIYSRNYYLKQSQLKEEIIDSQQKYYQKIYESDRELRKFRHDIRSQLGCLQLLLADGNTKQALEYLEKTGNHFEKLTLREFHTGSEILDVIIGQKYLESKKKGIRIIVEGKMSRTEMIDIYDLCVLFSNALDNSIEACERLQDREKVITVSIVNHRKVMFFQFMNPATLEMYEILKQGRTSKKDSQKHGFGVENMQTIVNRNGGEMKYIWKDETLILEIYFEL